MRHDTVYELVVPLFRCQSGDQRRIRPEEQVADRQASPVGNPALRQMVRPVVQHVAALTKRTQIRQAIV